MHHRWSWTARLRLYCSYPPPSVTKLGPAQKTTHHPCASPPSQIAGPAQPRRDRRRPPATCRLPYPTLSYYLLTAAAAAAAAAVRCWALLGRQNVTCQAAIPTRCRWRPLIDRAVTLHLPTLLYNAVPLIAMRPPALRLCTHHPCLPSPISGSGRDISQHTPAPTNPPPTAVSSTTPLAGLQKTCATSNARAPERLKPQLGLDSSSSSLPWSDHRPGPCHAVRQPAGHAPAARPWAETGKALLRSHAPTAHPCKPSRQGPWHREAWASCWRMNRTHSTSTTILEGARPHGGKVTLVRPSLASNPALSSR